MPDDSSEADTPSGTSEAGNESMAYEESPSLTENQLFITLTNQRRRHIINYLRNTSDGAVHRRDLIDFIVTQEAESEPPDDRREKVAIDLYHCQLPRLEEMGLIEMEGEDGAIRYRGHPGLEELLTTGDGDTGDPVGSSP